MKEAFIYLMSTFFFLGAYLTEEFKNPLEVWLDTLYRMTKEWG